MVWLSMWSCALQGYYGVTLLIGSMEGNPYLNQFLGFIVEPPAILATTLAIERVGRRYTAAALLLQGEGNCELMTSSCFCKHLCITAGLAFSCWGSFLSCNFERCLLDHVSIVIAINRDERQLLYGT